MKSVIIILLVMVSCRYGSCADPCFQHGESCMTAPDFCCDGLQCNHKSWKCQPSVPTTTTPYYTTSSQDCQPINEECGWFEDCCSGLTCSDGTCMPLHPTHSPSGPCIQIGASCFTSPEACCTGLHCNKDNWQCESDRPHTTTHPTTHRTHPTTHRTHPTTHHTHPTTHRTHPTTHRTHPTHPTTHHTTHYQCQEIYDYCDFSYWHCCDGLFCSGNSCVADIPTTTTHKPCLTTGAKCNDSLDCCSGSCDYYWSHQCY